MQKDILEHLLNQNIIKPSEEMLASNPFWAKKYFYKSGIQTQFPSIYHRFKYVIPEGSCVWRESINISLLTKSKVLVRFLTSNTFLPSTRAQLQLDSPL